MIRSWWSVVVGCLGLLAGAEPATAQQIDGLGVRALGMAGAFVAVADDATAVYWNPAGLPTGDFFSALAEHQVIDGGADVAGDVNGAGTAVLVGVPPLGVGYYRLKEAGSGLITHHVPVTLVQSIGDYVNVGAAVKAVRSRETRVDADLGVMLRFPTWRAGLLVRNVGTPTFPLAGGGEVTLERQVRTGVAVFPRDALTISADADLTTTTTVYGERRDLAIGAEQQLHPRAHVRGGVRLQTVGDVRPSASAGASVALTSLLWVDIQGTRGGDAAGGSVGIGLRAKF